MGWLLRNPTWTPKNIKEGYKEEKVKEIEEKLASTIKAKDYLT